MPLISKNLQTGRCSTEFDLDEREFYAIGRLCVQWAYLEHGIYWMTKEIARICDCPVPEDARSTSFKRRLRALRLMVEEFATPPEKKRMMRIIGQIANVEQDRHKIVHGMWAEDPRDPDRLLASSFRPTVEFEKRYNVDRIHELGTRIGALSFQIEYPGGYKEALEEAFTPDEVGNASYARIPRQLRRELKARPGRDRPDRGQAKPQGRKPPPPSSGE